MAPIGRLSKRFLNKTKRADEQTITSSPHDLRRTALTILAAMDVSAYALKRIAAHRQQSDVTAGYSSAELHRLPVTMAPPQSHDTPRQGNSHLLPLTRTQM